MEPIGILEDTLEVQELSKEHSDERERQKEMYLEQSEITIARKKWKRYLKQSSALCPHESCYNSNEGWVRSHVSKSINRRSPYVCMSSDDEIRAGYFWDLELVDP